MRLSADLLLVGSMPFATVEEMFGTCGPALGRYVAAMPDGEVGDRWDWIGYLRRHVFSKHPDLVVTGMTQDHDFSDPDRGVQYVEGQDSWETFQLRSGVDSLVFDDLHAGSVAVESYGVFRRLRDEGVIPEGVRFQVCFPGSSSAIEPYFSNPDDWPAAKRAYEAAVCVEVERMLEAIPADDLAVQFDLCYEVMDLAMGAGGSHNQFAPAQSFEEKLVRHTAQLGELWRAAPDQVLLGYHWCYGTWGGWPMIDMTDLGLCVELSNIAVERAGRPIDYVHMPVIHRPDTAFFAPLRDMELGDTRLYLGLIHISDGLAGFRERFALATQQQAEFGVSGVCGFGRHEPAEAPMIVRVLRECSAWLARANEKATLGRE